MNKRFLVLTFSLFAVSVYAQNSTQKEYEEWKPSQSEYKDFDIGKYTTPDIVRNQIDFKFDFHSSNSHNDYSYSNWDTRNDNSNINGNISSSFSHYVNTRKRISSLTGNLSIGEDYYSIKNKQSYSVDNSTTINNVSRLNQQNSLYLTWSNKWYFSKLIFMDYGIFGDIYYNFSQEKTKNQTEDSNQKEKDFRLYISPQLGIGYGRIEYVQDARQTVYIVNALSKNKVLTRNLSDDELFELSQIISTVKNKRFLDARLHLIEEITTLNSFFENNDLLADNGAAYFTTLYDMWQYGDLFPRKSGYEISFQIRPYYSFRNEKYTPEIQDMIYHSNEHLLSLSFSYEKPFKLNWQHSISTEVSSGFNSFSEQNKQIGNDYKNKTNYNSFYASANYSLGYYPNTRTHIQVTTRQEILKNVYDDESRHTYFSSVLTANLNYYFSPNLRLEGDYSLYYSPSRFKGNNVDYDKRNTFSSFFNIQLTYSIF